MPPSDEDRCFQKALELLARRSHFRRELEGKLRQRDFAEAAVEATLERLGAEGYLDDAATARAYVRERLRRGPLGRRRLLAELGRHGAGRDLAADALDELLPADETPLARQAAERWQGRHPQGGRDALARHLDRKGFQVAAIVAVLEAVEEHD